MAENAFMVNIVEQPAVTLIGMKVTTDMQHSFADCPKLWSEQFDERMPEVPLDGAMRSYGVCFMTDASTDRFDYWAAMPVKPGAAVPAGMEKTAIPAGTYAECAVDSLETLGAAYNYLYSQWLPAQKDYAGDMDRPSYEFYPGDFMTTGKLMLYIPVNKK